MLLRGLPERIRSVVSVPQDNSDLLKAKFRAFSHQMPMMYLMLLINTWTVAITFAGRAPAWLTIFIPACVTVVCVLRVVAWIRAWKVEPTEVAAMRELRRANLLSGLLAAAYSGWSLALFQYAGPLQQAHLAFYMAITVVGCIFCLVHLRSAAVLVAVVVNICFIAMFATSGDPMFIATSVNVGLVTCAMLAVVMVCNQDFARMVEALTRSEALSGDNFRLANIDSLTDLPNRRSFFSELDGALARARLDNTTFAVGILDLDDFKPVNDLYGHVTGDKLLWEVGQRLTRVCGEHVNVSRLGGDEFALIVSGLSQDGELLAFGERICGAIRQPFALEGACIRVAASIGFASYPEHAPDTTELFERADYALYFGKRGKRGGTVVFSPDHAAELQRDTRIEQALRTADFETEMSVVFQPIMDVASSKAIGFEALARWNSPLLGPVSPGLFVPIAERTGMVCRMTRVLLKKAIEAAKRWPEGLRLSFNLSARDFASSESVLRLVGIISTSGFDPRLIDLEITETAMLSDFTQMQRAVDVLKMLGCGISLDDFGTGYSSLSHLHAVPLTKIKIDRSFVAGLSQEKAGYKIVKSLLALSRDMDVGCIVEGVETREELDALRELGGSVVQGYYFSRPIAEGEIPDYLQNHHGSASAA